MDVIHNEDCLSISGGGINPGFPSPEMICSNVKLLVLGGYNQPGFDQGAAVQALMNVCANEFWDPAMAHEYVNTGGGITLPPPPPPPVPLP